MAAVLAEAEAARRRAEATAATASAQAVESAASASAAWEVADATEHSQSAAQSRAEAAESDVRNLQARVDDLTKQLGTALERVEVAESQATEVIAQRDAARQDSELAEAALAGERRESKEVAEQIRRKANGEFAAAQATCQAQVEAARELVSAAVARAERAEAALDTERTERQALTERLASVSAQLARSRVRATSRKPPRQSRLRRPGYRAMPLLPRRPPRRAPQGPAGSPEIVAYHPHAYIVIGRSSAWSELQQQGLHGLNARLHSITVMIYDHLLARAEAVLTALEKEGDHSA